MTHIPLAGWNILPAGSEPVVGALTPRPEDGGTAAPPSLELGPLSGSALAGRSWGPARGVRDSAKHLG